MNTLFRSLMLAVLALLPVVASAALQNGKVQVGMVKGTATLFDPASQQSALASGRVFEQGYRVETSASSTAELILSNGSTLIINPESLVEVRTFRQVVSELIIDGEYQKLDKEPSPSVTEIVVTRGKVIGEVRKLNPQSSYVIKTPVGVARIRGTIYTVQYTTTGANAGKLIVGCVKGSVEATVYAANSGPISVEPGKQISATAPAQSTAAPGEAPAPGTSQPGTTQPGTTETTPAGSVSISLADMDRVTISAIGATIAASTSLPAAISQGVEAQAQLAPTADQITPVTVSTPKTASSDPVQPNAPKSPVAPASTSTGGGNALDATISKITDTVQQVVEKQQQPNPSPTN
ncbi:MAG: FecR domain-containing protein [Verrucomicrobia bacterium]|nr:FecR domain-containing protein [Verrucomicrobiota bacterium]